ncbi:PREDICTED: uncharacterized protein LOC109165208 [Ipomoea nil]|uniref:uncharacterized protein LOC109165208 n=1 Tax=Ipomoea nil TaxID=35883 RepID=UPI00090121CE|nr:PREDICTED: uncharacterized protein LOC109165208 [Ipomoea nil]XP_019169424.1 PREDICTED: uncharacterized protein LOC109165208 [Ipomoea nil]
MEAKQAEREEVSAAQAVFVGALAPGVNAPTWNTLKIAFLLLAVCLATMLGLAFSSSDYMLTLHVTFLVFITGGLFLLLTRFLAETGLVSVEHQMQEIGLAPKDDEDKCKKSS